MLAHALRHSRWSLVALSAAAVLAGCDEDDNKSTFAPPEAPALAVGGAVDLGACDEIAAPEGSVLVFHAFADGVQIYQWNGTSWAFQGPSATLYSDANHTARVGTHYAGPTWESNTGGYIVGRLHTPCEVGSSDIPWLLLDGIRNVGPGIFQDVTSIQRVNTVGGRAPSAPGTTGEIRNVPYTAEYYFYRAP
jgi:uncharacterized protein DUF3455